MPTVVDTVVLHYFLVVDQMQLLLDLLEPPVGVPRIVFDPDDGQGVDAVVSELRQNIRYEERIADTPIPDGDHLTLELQGAQETAETKAERLRRIEDFVAGGRIEILDLTDAELDLLGRLTSRRPDAALGIMIALDDGEAACVAIAVERDWTLATDDGDALRVLAHLTPDHPDERLRRLLTGAAREGHVSEIEANQIHRQMQQAGSWDVVVPFPEADEQ